MKELFLDLLNQSIAASWLVLAVLLLRLAVRRMPKWVTVLLWSLVALRLVLPFSIESELSLLPSSETIPPALLSGPSFEVQTGIPAVDGAANEYLGTHYFEGVTVPTNYGVDLVQAGMLLWAIGVFALLAYTAVSYFRLRYRLRTATPLRDNIYQCDSIASPFVLGLLRPKIYLPYDLDGQALDHVIAHEQAHIRRRDHWWKPLGFALLSFHWMNPLLWLAYVLLCRDIELACDEKVIKALEAEQRADYSQALLSCSVGRRSLAACPLAFGEVGVKARVRSVMHYKTTAFWVLLLALLGCISLAVCFLTNPQNQNTPWHWSQNLSHEEVQSMKLWKRHRLMQDLSEEEISQVLSALNELEKENFTKNAQTSSGNPDWRLTITTDQGQIFLNEGPGGNLELSGLQEPWLLEAAALRESLIQFSEDNAPIPPVSDEEGLGGEEISNVLSCGPEPKTLSPEEQAAIAEVVWHKLSYQMQGGILPSFLGTSKDEPTAQLVCSSYAEFLALGEKLSELEQTIQANLDAFAQVPYAAYDIETKRDELSRFAETYRTCLADERYNEDFFAAHNLAVVEKAIYDGGVHILTEQVQGMKPLEKGTLEIELYQDYLSIPDSTSSEGHGTVSLYFLTTDKAVTELALRLQVRRNELEPGYYKPILYLYPQEETEVTVTLGRPELLTASYPAYVDGWKVLAQPNGDLTDLDTGRSLYSLYYESNNIYPNQASPEGFVVKGSEITAFLEEKLEILGLSPYEAEEFIIYWLPILQENPYNYIRFLSQDEISANMPLTISPQPDNIIRVMMVYQALDEPIEVTEQVLTRPSRSGFTAVEWGGGKIQ